MHPCRTRRAIQWLLSIKTENTKYRYSASLVVVSMMVRRNYSDPGKSLPYNHKQHEANKISVTPSPLVLHITVGLTGNGIYLYVLWILHLGWAEPASENI